MGRRLRHHTGQRSFWIGPGIGIATAIVLILVAGFVWYVGAIQAPSQSKPAKADAIVVLTGGVNRIEEGVRLLSEGFGSALLVTGVHRDVEPLELLAFAQLSPETIECCITLGYEAADTIGNAAEAGAWVYDNGYASVHLVTANYHMPRALLEFAVAMPEMEIRPHPVDSGSLRLPDWWMSLRTTTFLMQEYLKYIAALLRATVTQLHQTDLID